MPQRFSQQRERIYQAVLESRAHPTAEMVYQQLKPEMPRLSLGTVYRNLQQMAREGRLTELDGPVTRFDAVTRPHTHFRCRACGAVLDLETVPYDETLDRLAAAQGCVVTGHTLIFTGHCPRCAGQEGRHEYRPEEKRDNCKI
ncbi:MAG TPA: transcriptional repressor [Candidatus Oscillibacter pullicola]|nr:transcriptional repressor [Candidatus Oscillibacter pullicola]